MIGYVEAWKPELKMQEYEIYSGYYCGLCKEIGRNYSQILRKGLSYDMTFLALLLSSMDDGLDHVKLEHCISHHIAKRPVITNSAVTYAADMMMILGYEQMLDAERDGDEKNRVFGNIGKSALRKAYNKASGKHPFEAGRIGRALDKLVQLEIKHCGHPDLVADAFADVMEEVFLGYMRMDASPGGPGITPEERVCADFSRHLGRWIYIIDALDDLDKDIASDRAYNPFLCEKGGRSAFDDPAEAAKIKKEICEEAKAMLFHYLDRMSKAYDLLSIKKNKGILDNVIFLGLRHKTEEVLKKYGAEQAIGDNR